MFSAYLMLVGDTLRQQAVVGEEAGAVHGGVVVPVPRLHCVRRQQY